VRQLHLKTQLHDIFNKSSSVLDKDVGLKFVYFTFSADFIFFFFFFSSSSISFLSSVQAVSLELEGRLKAAMILAAVAARTAAERFFS
jgi:hypothetical protein